MRHAGVSDRASLPLNWARTQNDLGIAFGTRESGTARLDETVTAYRDAVKEHTRERVPLQMGHDPEQSRSR
jgi:hypothetical protein